MANKFSYAELKEMVRVFYCEANSNTQQAIKIYKKRSIPKLKSSDGNKRFLVPKKAFYKKVIADFNKAELSGIITEEKDDLKNTSNCPEIKNNKLKYCPDNPSSNPKKASDHQKSSGCINYDTSDHHPQKEANLPFLYIYTTRLDDMSVLLKLKGNKTIYNDSLLEQIEDESKPKFEVKRISRKRKHTASCGFYSLENKFLKRNEYISKRTQQLKSPVKVVLTRCDEIVSNVKQCNVTDTSIVKEKDEDNDVIEIRSVSDTVTLSDSDDEPIILNKKEHLNKKWQIVMTKRNGPHNILLSYNHKNELTSLINYKSLVEIGSCLKSSPGLFLDVCCWFKLHHVKKRVNFVYIPNEGHLCQQICKCCCQVPSTDPECLLRDDSANIKNKSSVILEYHPLNTVEDTFLANVLKTRKPSRILQNAASFKIQLPNKNEIETFENVLHQNEMFHFVYSNDTKDMFLFRFKGNAAMHYHRIDTNVLPVFDTVSKFYIKKHKKDSTYQICCRNKLSNILNNISENNCKTKMIRLINRLSACPVNGRFKNCCPIQIQDRKHKHMQFTNPIDLTGWGHGIINRIVITAPEAAAKLAALNRKEQTETLKKMSKPYFNLNSSQTQTSVKKNTSGAIKSKADSQRSVESNTNAVMLLHSVDSTGNSTSTGITANPRKSTKTLSNSVGNVTKPRKAVQPKQRRAKNTKSKEQMQKQNQPSKLNSSAVLIPITNISTTSDVTVQQMYNSAAPAVLTPVFYEPKSTPTMKIVTPTQTTPVLNPDGTIPNFTGDISAHVLSVIAEVPEAEPHKDEILKMFQNLVIYLDTFGKVTTALPKPVTLLTPVEIKVLSKLLGKAEQAVFKKPESDVPNKPKPTLQQPLQTFVAKKQTKSYKFLSLVSAKKSKAYKNYLYGSKTNLQKSFLDRLETDATSVIPKIQNVFSYNEKQDFVQPGPSGVNQPGPIVNQLNPPVESQYSVTMNNPSFNNHNSLAGTPLIVLPLEEFNHLSSFPYIPNASPIQSATNVAPHMLPNNNTPFYIPTPIHANEEPLKEILTPVPTMQAPSVLDKNIMLRNLLTNSLPFPNKATPLNSQADIPVNYPVSFVIETEEEEIEIKDEIEIEEETNIDEECILGF